MKRNGKEKQQQESDRGLAGHMAAFQASDMVIEQSSTSSTKPDVTNLLFGKVFTDLMLTTEWSIDEGWREPHMDLLKPVCSPGVFSPALCSPDVLCLMVYTSIQFFEGMKAYWGQDGRVRLFRPMLNTKRMLYSAKRACLPSFDAAELLECPRMLLELDQEWVPHSDRLEVWPDRSDVVCSWVSSHLRNYGASVYAKYDAVGSGCQQVLRPYGEDYQTTEAGTMNIFLYWIDEGRVVALGTL
ncbi:branched-chain-amino-acid aminotransferase, cytosolic [Arapaima gigas]